MADLRIVDAPLLSTVKGTEKIPTGGEGNFSVSVNQVADFAKLKWVLATEGYVNNAVVSVQADLSLHKNNKANPHNVTKTQVGLGNVDNTADLDKPVSNATQSAIITAVNPKADKTYVDDQLEFKADKQDVYTKLETYTKQESADLVSSNISVALTPINYSLDLAKRGVINTFNSTLSYNTNDRVVLSDGGFVVSTIDGNTNDPNTDMTGWFLPYMRGSQNLVELTDKATSRSNLDVYSKGEALAKDNNLSELTDKVVARTNLDVYSKAETNTVISNATTPTATETIAGKAKIATTAIAQAGVNDTDFITPKKLFDFIKTNVIKNDFVDVTSSRVRDVTYTNPSPSSYLNVRINATINGSGSSVSVFVNNKLEIKTTVSGGGAWGETIFLLVPPLGTYRMEGVSIVVYWGEA